MGYLGVIPVFVFLLIYGTFFEVQYLKLSVRLFGMFFMVQLDLVLAIGNISLLHYCQFGTENHSLLEKN